MRIAICASEVVPFAKTGGLADVSGALPLALEGLGHKVAVIMPRYKSISDSKFRIHRLRDDVSYSIMGRDIKVYFIENEKYFDRDGLYGDKNGDYKDNLDRFSYYCKRALELLKEINFSRPTINMSGGIPPRAEKADIIHVHDWQAALIPVYLKSLYINDIFYKNTKTIFTIHNIGYQGLFPKEEFPKLGLDWSLFNMEGLEFYDKINILKGGIVFSDIINTVSPTYSKEIQTKEFGFGLEGILSKRRQSVFGILNGLDYSIWNPETDKFLAKNYSPQNIEDKYKNKENLQKSCRLPNKKDVPLFGIVSRLAQQKGFDILAEAIDKICKMHLQLVILGTGDLKYHLILEEMVKKYPKVISLYLKFDDPLAHNIYAGSDIFLMPSKYEPCGLGQLISLKYATIPLVFKTGGLADTVTEDNGFIFDNYKKEDLLKTMDEAIQAFKNKKKWSERMQRAMQCNFSWEESAKKYLELYKKAKS
jgi:starch synthase